MRATGHRSLLLSRRYASSFSKVLVANRGEIAVRIMKTCHKLGMKAVAVHSEADSNALHVQAADEAVCIGPPPSVHSYLHQDRVLDAIRSTRADALHPGYGFLSENVGFAERVVETGCAYIGPPVSAMRLMGDKLSAKRTAREVGVQVLPDGGAVDTEEDVKRVCSSIGFPVMLKASAGGGGKGLRIAWNEEEAVEGFRISKEEAQASFGDTFLFVERYLSSAKHIEFQLIGDHHGNMVHLFERDCSVQRRHQKVIEEAPSTALTPEMRARLGRQAVALAQTAGYASAGTVEFLVDTVSGEHYFLEMNTRLQVEHPITEMITGVDLVELMLRVAAGEPLGFSQEDVQVDGWAFESRVYAEDPTNCFLPSIGTLHKYRPPEMVGVRVDSGVYDGYSIGFHYDPIMSKVITHAQSRKEALRLAKEALDRFTIQGVKNNIGLLRSAYELPQLVDGSYNVDLLETSYPNGFQGHQLSSTEYESLVASTVLVHWKRVRSRETISGRSRLAQPSDLSKLHVHMDGGIAEVEVESCEQEGKGTRLQLIIGGKPVSVQSSFNAEDTVVETQVNSNEARVLQLAGVDSYTYSLVHVGSLFNVQVMTAFESNLKKHMPAKAEKYSSHSIVSPMPGVVCSVTVKEGDTLTPGSEICVIEAMKMQNVIRATHSGIVKALHVSSGQQVDLHEVLVETG